jgi:hypothetical protein
MGRDCRSLKAAASHNKEIPSRKAKRRENPPFNP